MRSLVPDERSGRTESSAEFPSTHRRRFLTSAMGTAAAALAGCLDLGSEGSESSAFEPTEGWPTYRGDRQRTGRAPADAGPGESLSVAWETSVYDLIDTRETVVAERPVEADENDPVASGYCSDVTLTKEFALCTMYYQLHLEGEDGTSWGGVVALDAASGSIEWTISGTPAIMQAPAVVDDRLYLGVVYPMTDAVDQPHVLVADAASGEVLHRRTGPTITRDAPTFTDDGAYLVTPDEAGYTLQSVDPER